MLLIILDIQWVIFDTFYVHMDNLGLLLKWSFWFSWSVVRAEILQQQYRKWNKREREIEILD